MRPTLLTPFQVLWRRSALEKSCQWTRVQLDQHQARQASELRRFALERSPFYQRFHRGLENRPLSELPILTKAMMMENFDQLVTDRSLRLADAEAYLASNPGPELFRNRYVVLSTSGSTGRRGVFLFSKSEWLMALAGITRPMAWAGLSGGLQKPPRSAMVASKTPWHYSARVTMSLASRLLPALRLDAAEPLESMVRQLNDWQPQVLAGYPSVLRQLAEEQIAGRLRLKLRSVATSAEVLTDETRRRVREAWGLRMFDTYGATEYAPIAAECTEGNKHLFEDGAVIEIVDEQGKAVPAGAAGDRILLTIFGRQTQPLIRYEISDMVRPLDGECACGRKMRLIEAVEGRIEDVLYFPRRDGRDELLAAHPNLFHEILETVPAAGWQVVYDGDCLSVRLTGVRDGSICGPVGRSIERMLNAQGANVPRLEVRVVDTLERGATGKAPLILSRKRDPAWRAAGG